MSAQLRTQCRSSSPSPAGLLRRHRSAASPTEQSSPWCRGTSRHGGGRGRWAMPSISPFERSGSTNTVVPPVGNNHVTDDGGNGDDDDYWMCDDEAFDDEDGGGLSLEEARRSSWLRGFLAQIGEMGPDDMGDPAAAILCPACKGGPGGSLRYRGLQALLDHARSVMAKRVKLHRRFAEILEIELRARRRNQDDSSEKAERLAEGVAGDRTIPWPPMVVVLNTRIGKQEGSDKWVGMGNRDLLDCFREYEPVKSRSAYGSHGHRGASLLIFDGTLLGYLQAQRLHNQFIQEGRGKYEWHKQKPSKQAAETRLLYGYMAMKEEELSIFATHPGDKRKFKYEMKPYQEVVGNPMYGRSQKQALLEREIAKEVQHYKSLEMTCEQRGQEIEAIRRMLNEQSDEHNKEIESMSECTERLNSKLRESELLRKKMQEQITSLCSAAGDDDGVASSTLQLVNHMNSGDGEHGKPEKERMDEIAEEQRYVAAACDSGGKNKRPLLQGVPCN
ncbi:hypothetical protein Taro_040898 [Colocasia esculenta]|uniref:Uncharacterized protein n=1 Tax=Colocasia esculenta TaxID=4460 RepID=A0A843WUA8_COLES|nr:hypothetical protein [Colocasia esculenta]